MEPISSLSFDTPQTDPVATDQSLLTFPPAERQTETPPPNREEVAAQLAATKEGDYKQNAINYLNEIDQMGQTPLHTSVYQNRKDEELRVAKDTATFYAGKNDPVTVQKVLQGAVDKHNETPTKAQVYTESAKDSIESLTASSADKYVSLEHYLNTADNGAESWAAANILNQNLADSVHRVESKVSILNTISNFGNQILAPGTDMVASIRLANSITGSNTVSEYEAFKTLANMLAGMGKDEQALILKKIESADLGVYGITYNPNAILLFFKKLQSYSSGDFATDVAFTALDATIVYDMVGALGHVVRAGKTLPVLVDTAGAKKAAEVLASDLTQGTNVSGLTTPERVDAALAMGINPIDADPALRTGMSSTAQEALQSAQKKLYQITTEERLVASGLTAEEESIAKAEIRAKYDPATNKSVHSVQFSEGTDGVHMNVIWRNADGKDFLTKEAATAFAKERGMADFKIIDKSGTDAFKSTLDEADKEVIKEHFINYKTYLEEKWISANSKGDKEKEILFQEKLNELNKWEVKLENKTLTRKEEHDLQNYLFNTGDELHSLGNSISIEEELGLPLFESGNKLEFTSNISPEVKGLVTDLHKAFGFQRNMIVSSYDDFVNIARRDTNLSMLLDQVAQASYRGKGAYKGGISVSGKEAHLIVLDNEMAAKDLAMTTAHEFGHAFDKEFLKSPKNAKLRDALEADFTTWMKQNKGAEGKKFVEFMAKRQDLVSRENLVQKMADGRINKMSDLSPSFASWTKDFDEYWADQFAKALISTPQTAGIVKQYFKQLYDGIIAAYKMIAERLGVKDVGTPEKIIQDFLKKHLELVAKGKSMPLAPWNANDVAYAAKEGSKPRIKLKSSSVPSTPSSPVGYLIKETRVDPLPYTKEGFSKADIESRPWIAVDPKHGASDFLVGERVVGIHAEAKIKKAMSDYLKPFISPLSKAEKERVGAILTEGDAYSDVSGAVGKEFSYLELKARNFNEKESTAYFAIRGMRQFLWRQKNADEVRHLGALGYQEVGITIKGKSGPELRKFVGKKLQEDNLGSRVVYDASKGTTVKLTDEIRAEMKISGSYITELYLPQKINGKMQKYIISHPDHVSSKNLTTVIPYRPGEFSRIYTDEYFIVARRSGEVDGIPYVHTDGKPGWMDTIRTAASEREASEFITSMKGGIALMRAHTSGSIRIRDLEASMEKILGKYMDPQEFINEYKAGEFDNLLSLDFHYTRTKEEYLNGSINEAISSGRTFSSKRNERLYSVDRNRPNTLDVFKSIQAEMANTSRIMAVAQWRENAIRRWMNTYGDKVPNRTGNDVADFFKVANLSFVKRDQSTAFAESTHKYIMRQIGIKTNEEQKYDAFFRGMTEKYFQGDTKVEAMGAALRQKSFLGFLRNVNFNLTLGMWNPSQLLVQANGAVTALALSPIHGLAAIKTFPLLRMALMSDRPDVWKSIASMQKLSDMGFSSSEEFTKLVQGIRKAGILDNLKSTSLWNLEDGASDMFANYTSKIWGTHTFGFDRGEEFSRVVSFDVAHREWKKLNPEKDWTSSVALKEIVKRTDDLTQNMTRANLASFQEGALSIPFQFLQYNIKLASNILSSAVSGGITKNWTAATKTGRGFTKTEALSLLAGHAVLYGAAGNGLNYIVDEMIPESARNSMTVEQKAYIGQGLISGLINSISEMTTGKSTNIAVGSRLGTFDYYQKLAEAIFLHPANIYDALLGPTASTGKRLGVAADVAALWYADPDLSAKDVIEGLTKVGVEQWATARNATKAYIYATNEGKMSDRAGNTIGNVNTAEMLAAAIGFPPTVAQDVYNMYKSKKDHDATMKDLADMIAGVQKDILFEIQKGTEEGRQRAVDKKKTLQALWPKNAGDMFVVQRLIKDKIYPYDSQFQKLLGNHLWKGYNDPLPLVITKEPNTP